MRGILCSLALTLVALLLAQCGSVRPAKYYMLEVPASQSPARDQIPVTLLVGHITAPHLFRDDRIVYATGPVQLGTYEYQRWAEPPTDMLEAMLLQTLRLSGQYRSVERMSSSARGDYILHGHLFALEEVDKPAIMARVTLELELYQPKTGTTVWSQFYTHDEPARRKTMWAVVEALNNNVQQAMDQLTAGLVQYFENSQKK